MGGGGELTDCWPSESARTGVLRALVDRAATLNAHAAEVVTVCLAF